MRVTLLTNWEDWPGGADAWDRLLGASAVNVPFLTWQWHTIWWQHFGPPGSLRLFVVEEGSGEPVGVLPLMAVGEGVLRFVGGVDISDYLDIVSRRGREEEVWKALLAALGERQWGSLDLHCLPADSPTIPLLPALTAAQGLRVRVEREERCPILDLPADWETYLAGLDAKARHELRRKLRRCERTHPDARARLVTEAEISAALDTFFVLHRKSSAGKARFMDERMEAFFRTAASEFAKREWLQLWTLEAERPLAALLCFDYAGVVSVYNSGFEPDARAASPGIVLIAHALREAISRGRQRFDFLRGEEAYKYDFGARPTDLLRVVVER